MANYVNMPDFDYGGYLAHHGIIGQKWGVRRFQNKDGTWTNAGKERYGRGGVARRLMTGDYAFGNKRIQEKNEEYLKNRIAKRKAKGKDTSKLEEQYKIRRNANRDLDNYLSETSTKKLAAQNLLLNVGADTYRKARARGEGRGSAFASALLTDASIPLGYAVDSIKEQKLYGSNKKSKDAGYSITKEERKKLSDLAKQGQNGQHELAKQPAIKQASKQIQKEREKFSELTKQRSKVIKDNKITERMLWDYDWVYKSNDPRAIAYRKVDKAYNKAFKDYTKAAKKQAKKLMGASGYVPITAPTNLNSFNVNEQVANMIMYEPLWNR